MINLIFPLKLKGVFVTIKFIKEITMQINNDTLFFSLWFMHLDDKIAGKILQSKELMPYRYNLELIRKSKPYTKTEDVEKILQIKDITGGEAYAEIYSIITNNYSYDWFGKKVSLEDITQYFKSENPKLREKAYETILSKYGADSTVLAEIYKDVVTDWCNDGIKIRGYKNSINIRNIRALCSLNINKRNIRACEGFGTV